MRGNKMERWGRRWQGLEKGNRVKILRKKRKVAFNGFIGIFTESSIFWKYRPIFWIGRFIDKYRYISAVTNRPTGIWTTDGSIPLQWQNGYKETFFKKSFDQLAIFQVLETTLSSSVKPARSYLLPTILRKMKRVWRGGAWIC